MDIRTGKCNLRDKTIWKYVCRKNFLPTSQKANNTVKYVSYLCQTTYSDALNRDEFFHVLLNYTQYAC